MFIRDLMDKKHNKTVFLTKNDQKSAFLVIPAKPAPCLIGGRNPFLKIFI